LSALVRALSEPSDQHCGARAEGFRINCGLPEGHVKTADDWHEGSVTNIAHQEHRTYTVHTEGTETVRWAPHHFEVPRPEESEESKAT